MGFFKATACLALVLAFCTLMGCATERTDATLLNLLQASERDPQNPKLHADLVQLYWSRYQTTRNTGFLHTAANELKEVIRLRPDDPWAHSMLGRTYFLIDKRELALFEAKEATRLDPEYSFNHRMLGVLYMVNSYSDETCYDDEMTELGMNEFKQAVRLSPEDSYSHNGLGSLYGAKGSYDLALFEMKEAVRLFNSPNNRKWLGRALYQKGDYEVAILEYNAALAMDLRLAELHVSLAWTYLLLNRAADSLKEIALYRKSNRRRSTDDVLCEYLSLKQTGQNDKAAKSLSEHYTRDTNRKKWETDLLQYHLGRISEDELINSARHKCDRCDAFFYIGYSHFLQNEKQAAMNYFQKALDTNVYGSWLYTGARAMLEKLDAGGGDEL